MIGSQAAGRVPAADLARRTSAGALWCARTILYLVVAASVGARGGDDAGFVRLLANGRAILAAHELSGRFDALSSVLYAAVEQGAGRAGVVAFGAICAIGMLVLVEAQARERGANPTAALAVAALTAAVSAGTLTADGGSFAWLAAAAFVFTLAGTEKQRWLVAVPLAWAWAASSWIGVAAPVLALAALLGRRDDRALFAILGGSALAIFATPAGLDLPREALAQLSLAGAAGKVLAWQPDVVSSVAYRFGLIPIVVALVWFRLSRLGDLPLVAVALTLSLAAGTAMPLAGIVILPCLAGDSGLPVDRESVRRLPAWHALGVALLCALLAPLVLVSRTAPSDAEAALPQALIEALAARPAGRTVVACAPAKWCALVEALGRNDLRAFVSDRIGSQTEEHLLDQIAIAHVRPTWRVAIARNGIGAILVANGQGLATLLSLQPDWHAAARGERATLYLRAERAPR